MATPYLQERQDSVGSTQDVARANFSSLPVVVITPEQKAGRGRLGAPWETADRALAVSVAIADEPMDARPLSLVAAVAVLRTVENVDLKWPNDLNVDGHKVGGILVERSAGVAVIGLGLNLWWPDAPPGMTALLASDPGPEHHIEVGALFAAELLGLISDEGWPLDEYRQACTTIGQPIAWDPNGVGTAEDVNGDGTLEVRVDDGLVSLVAGEVRHVRPV